MNLLEEIFTSLPFFLPLAVIEVLVARLIFLELSFVVESIMGLHSELRTVLRRSLLKIVAGESVANEARFLAELGRAIAVGL